MEAVQAVWLICRGGGEAKDIIEEAFALTLAMEGILPPRSYGALMRTTQEENLTKLTSRDTVAS